MAPLQAGFAEAHANDYAHVLSVTIAVVAVALILVTWLGREAHAAELTVA